MKKIAILLPGLVRSYKKTYNNFTTNILKENSDKYEIDVFLAFWDYTHKRGPMGSKTEKRKLSQEEIEDIVKMYSPKKHIILTDYKDKNKMFEDKSKEIAKKMGIPRHEDGIALIQNGILAQTYTWQKAFSLIDGEYDLVLKTRFDAASEKIDFDKIIDRHFNCSGPSHQFVQYGLADVIFSSDHKTMHKIMSNYHNDAMENRLSIPEKGYPNIFQEYILREFLKQLQIKINYIEKKVYIIR